jgi:hypothetical protein
MTLIDASRVSFSSCADVHDVGYDAIGTAYCKREDHHHWKYGDEHFADRSKYGYIAFGDRHLGMAVEHRVAVLPGEDYVEFWTRMKKAENLGQIEVIGSSAYSIADVNILGREAPGLTVEKLEIDPDALIGMTEEEGKAWRESENAKIYGGAPTIEPDKGINPMWIAVPLIGAALVLWWVVFKP